MKESFLVSLLLLWISWSTCNEEFPSLNKPFFSPLSPEVVRGQVGGVAYLECEVYNRNNLSVSWIRAKDGHILTVDCETFIADARFVQIERREKMFDLISLVIHDLKAGFPVMHSS